MERECIFSAIKMYLNEKDEWPQNVVTLEPTYEKRLEALKNGPYGRCVYRSDNDVVDHQVVNLLFDNEVTVAFTMSAFTNETSRTFQIMGTKEKLSEITKQMKLKSSIFQARWKRFILKKSKGAMTGRTRL